MGAILSAVVVLVIIAFIATFVGVGAEAGADLKKEIEDAQEAVADQPDSNLSKTGNIAKEIGADVCNLEMRWVGSITANAPFNPESLVTDQEFLWMGNVAQNPALTFAQPSNTNIREYTWFCNFSNPLSFYNMELKKFALFDPDESSGDTIRIKWVAKSLDTNKFMFDKNGRGDNNNPFQQETFVRFGAPLPADWVAEDLFESVTHDDYLIEYWSDTHEVNGEQLGKRFKITLCEAGKQSC